MIFLDGIRGNTMRHREQNHDEFDIDDPAFWAAGQLLAVAARDQERARFCSSNLERHGYRIVYLNTKSPRPGARVGPVAVCSAQRGDSHAGAGRVFSPPTCHARRGAGVNAAAGASAASAGRVSITENP